MQMRETDLVSLFEHYLKDASQIDLHEVGLVTSVGDFYCYVHGLHNAIYGELVDFDGGNQGIVMNLSEEQAIVFLLYPNIPVAELEVVKRTGDVLKTPVGFSLLGRVVDATGTPIDGLGTLEAEGLVSLETDVPGIMKRSPINESLETGIMAIDALVPIGKGQRELLIGNRNTGKSSIALDIILHQRDKEVYCVYAAIGQRQANVARTVQLLEQNGAMAYTTVVSADAGSPALAQYLAPYTACTIAEYLRSQGKDVLIVYDDLSNHAIAYREISLLMRRSPGREAYPGDVFYLHSRLLERAGKLLDGGSLTALPIVQIQSDDITAYIPTNLISITDGQIFLDSKLFNAGIRPAVNVELSVSRVGGAAQTKAIKAVTKALRLELAQYHELLAFSQFGSELDAVSQRQLARGNLCMELLKQPQYQTYSFVQQSLQLFLLRENMLDAYPLTQVKQRAVQFADYVLANYDDVYMTIQETKNITPEISKKLKAIAQEYQSLFMEDVLKAD